MSFDPKRFQFTVPNRRLKTPGATKLTAAPAPQPISGTGEGYLRPYLPWFKRAKAK